MVQIAVAILISAASVAAVYLLSRPPRNKETALDQSITPLAKRGTYIPLVLGRRTVGPVFCWAGSRYIVREKTSGGGKGGGQSTRINIYYESAMCVLCIGPGEKLWSIKKGGEIIWKGPIDRYSNPSGTSITLDNNEGTFFIYWGEYDQPVNSYLGAGTRIGANSRWPYFMYILWNAKRLGRGVNWPNLKYEVSVAPLNSKMASEPMGGGEFGYDLMHCIDQLMFAPSPHGGALDRTLFDQSSFATVARTPNMPACNIYIRSGLELTDALIGIFKDASLALPWMVDRGKFFLKAIRDEEIGGIPTIPADIVTQDLPEITSDHDARKVNAITYTFFDVARDHDENTVTVSQDGEQVEIDLNQARPRKEALTIAITHTQAVEIAERRAQEANGQGSAYEIFCGRQGRNMFPSKAFFLDPSLGVSVLLRVISKTIDVLTGEVKLECVEDYLGLPPTAFNDHDPGAIIIPEGDPTPNLPTNPFEVPAHAGPGGPGGGVNVPLVIVPWLRTFAAGSSLEQAIEIYVSPTDVAYHVIGVVGDFMPGGFLDATFDSDTSTFLENGPVINTYSSGEGVTDSNLILDLRGSLEEFWAGRQVCLINQELFLLRNVIALGGGQFELRGLVRSRLLTSKQLHSVGDHVFIFDPSNIPAFSDIFFGVDQDMFLKIRTLALGGALTLGDTDAQAFHTNGNGIIPLRTGPPRQPSLLDTVIEGEDIPLKWDYTTLRSRVNFTGAGYQPAGSASGVSVPDGHFTIEVAFVGGSVVRSIDTDDSQYLYSWEDFLTDFGSVTPPFDFSVRIFTCFEGYNGPSNGAAFTIITDPS